MKLSSKKLPSDGFSEAVENGLGNLLLFLFSPLHKSKSYGGKNAQEVVVIFKIEFLSVSQNLKAFKLEMILEIT